MSDNDALTRHSIHRLEDFQFDDGTVLPATAIAYTTYGELNGSRDNVIVFPTWFVGTHTDLEYLIGPGEPLDTDRYFVVVPSMFANGLSSSPSNTPAPHDRGRFPEVSIADNVRAQHRLLTEVFDVRGIELAIGGSMGAFQAYQWGLSHPELVARVLASCGAARVSRHCYVFLAGVRAALETDAAFADGEYESPPEAGLRAVGRVYAGWGFSQAFYRDRRYEDLGFSSVDEFLTGFWEAFFSVLDANDLLSQLATWQQADISKTPGYDMDLTAALSAIRAKTYVTPAERDLYFPPEDMAWEAEQIPDAEVHVIPGIFGHLSEAGMDPACAASLGDTIRKLLAAESDA